jgi:hypothetical protein
MNSWAAACAFDAPSATSRATSISRGDRTTGGFGVSVALRRNAGRGFPPANAMTSGSVRADPAAYADWYRAAPSRSRMSALTRSCSSSIGSGCTHQLGIRGPSGRPRPDEAGRDARQRPGAPARQDAGLPLDDAAPLRGGRHSRTRVQLPDAPGGHLGRSRPVPEMRHEAHGGSFNPAERPSRSERREVPRDRARECLGQDRGSVRLSDASRGHRIGSDGVSEVRNVARACRSDHTRECDRDPFPGASR